jgi:hypothetical protein
MKNKITIADMIMAIGALLTFIFSFLAFFDFGRGDSPSAWDTDVAAFATTVPAVLALVMVVWIVLELAGVSLPSKVLTYSPAQLKGTWGFGAAGIMLSWVSVDIGDGKGAGFTLMLIGSLAMAVGASMTLLGKGTETIDIPGVSDGDADAAE